MGVGAVHRVTFDHQKLAKAHPFSIAIDVTDDPHGLAEWHPGSSGALAVIVTPSFVISRALPVASVRRTASLPSTRVIARAVVDGDPVGVEGHGAVGALTEQDPLGAVRVLELEGVRLDVLMSCSVGVA